MYACHNAPMRIASRFLAAAVIALPLFASAQNVQDLQAQAQALLDRISALQQQLGNSGGTPGATLTTASSVACPQLGKSLKRGSSGEDVRRLQVFLSNDPSVYPEGQITGYYGALTEAAVKRWQVKFNIVSTGTAETTGFGVVGPRTAAVLALQCAGTASASGGVSGVVFVSSRRPAKPGYLPSSVSYRPTRSSLLRLFCLKRFCQSPRNHRWPQFV